MAIKEPGRAASLLMQERTSAVVPGLGFGEECKVTLARQQAQVFMASTADGPVCENPGAITLQTAAYRAVGIVAEVQGAAQFKRVFLLFNPDPYIIEEGALPSSGNRHSLA